MKKSSLNITCNLVYLLQNKDISYEKLAAKTGISLSTLKRYGALTTIPRLDDAFRIAQVLNTGILQIWHIF